MRLKAIFSVLISGLIAFAPMAAMADETASIRFILTGDLYELPAGEGRGGYAKLASVAQIFKKKTKRKYMPFWFMRVMHILHHCSQLWIKVRVL